MRQALQVGIQTGACLERFDGHDLVEDTSLRLDGDDLVAQLDAGPRGLRAGLDLGDHAVVAEREAEPQRSTSKRRRVRGGWDGAFARSWRSSRRRRHGR